MADKRKERTVRALCRYEELTGGELMLQRKFRRCIFWSKWKDVHLYDEEVYEINEELNYLNEQELKLIAELLKVESFLKRKKKEVDGAMRNRRGEGKPFMYDLPVSHSRPRKRNSFKMKVEQKWKEYFNPKRLNKLGVNGSDRTSTRDKVGMEDTRGHGRKAVYISEEDKKKLKTSFDGETMQLSEDLSSSITYKEPKKQKNQLSKKERKQLQQQEEQEY